MSEKTLPPFSHTRQVFYAGLAAFLLALFSYGYLFYTVRATGARTAILEKETEELKAKESQVGQLRTELVRTEEERKKLASYFIDAKDIIPFLETVEGYASDMGVSVKFNTVATAKNPNRLDLALAAEGSFASLYRFIALLEAAPYEIAFKNANISILPDGGADEKGKSAAVRWEARITLSVLSISGIQ